MNPLRIGNLTARIPIIQGGMGVCVSLSGLASAVAEEGGIGVISAVGIGMMEPDYRNNFRNSNRIALRKEIRKAREKSKGILGVNIMLAVSDFEDLLQVSLEEHIDIVFMGAGLPLKWPQNISEKLVEESGAKFVPKVSSARAAKLIFTFWDNKYNNIPDAIVVEGPLAGGHMGFSRADINNSEINLSNILKETINEVDCFQQKYGKEIPVIAGGGIYSGKDVFDVLEAGAKGVKMGTRFVTTTECDVSESFKDNYIHCSKEDITIIDSPVGLPGRVISNDFVKEIQNGRQKPVSCPWKCLKTCNYKEVQFCIAQALFNAAKGDFRQGFSFAGSKAFLAREIISVKETIKRIKEEYDLVKTQMQVIPVF